jgi:hypothetical protein
MIGQASRSANPVPARQWTGRDRRGATIRVLLYTDVAYFSDLTPYSYWSSSPSYAPHRDEPWPQLPVVNVGWLDAGHPFATGALPGGLLARLGELAKVRVMQTRGYHLCELCIRDLGGGPELEDLDADARDELLASLPRRSAGTGSPITGRSGKFFDRGDRRKPCSK